jgi:hypothetical protein
MVRSKRKKSVHSRQLPKGSTPVMRCKPYLELKYPQVFFGQLLVFLYQLASNLRQFRV